MMWTTPDRKTNRPSRSKTTTDCLSSERQQEPSIPHALVYIMWFRHNTVQLYRDGDVIIVSSLRAKCQSNPVAPRWRCCLPNKMTKCLPSVLSCTMSPSPVWVAYCANKINTFKAFNWRLPDSECPHEHISTAWLTDVAGYSAIMCGCRRATQATQP